MLDYILKVSSEGYFQKLSSSIGDSVKMYAKGRQSGSDRQNLAVLKDEAAELIGRAMDVSGYKPEGFDYINIDREFFSSEGDFDLQRLEKFQKEMVLQQAKEEMLWTFAGTTGSFTPITKKRLIEEGRDYESLLPGELKKQKKDNGKDNRFFLYPSGKISMSKLDPDRDIRYDRLKDTSGFDWSRGYEPGRSLDKNWQGAYNEAGFWVKAGEVASGGNIGEIANNGVNDSLQLVFLEDDSVFLEDPDNLLEEGRQEIFFQESGEVYGGRQIHREKTLERIKETLRGRGVKSLGAIVLGKSDSHSIDFYRESLSEFLDLQTIIAAKDDGAIIKKRAAVKQSALTISASSRVIKGINLLVEENLPAEAVSLAMEMERTEDFNISLTPLDLLENPDKVEIISSMGGYLDDEAWTYLESLEMEGGISENKSSLECKEDRITENNQKSVENFARATAMVASSARDKFKKFGVNQKQVLEKAYKRYVEGDKTSGLDLVESSENSLKAILGSTPVSAGLPSGIDTRGFFNKGKRDPWIDTNVSSLAGQKAGEDLKVYMETLELPPIERTAFFNHFQAGMSHFKSLRASLGLTPKELAVASYNIVTNNPVVGTYGGKKVILENNLADFMDSELASAGFYRTVSPLSKLINTDTESEHLKKNGNNNVSPLDREDKRPLVPIELKEMETGEDLMILIENQTDLEPIEKEAALEQLRDITVPASVAYEFDRNARELILNADGRSQLPDQLKTLAKGLGESLSAPIVSNTDSLGSAMTFALGPQWSWMNSKDQEDLSGQLQSMKIPALQAGGLGSYLSRKVSGQDSWKKAMTNALKEILVSPVKLSSGKTNDQSVGVVNTPLKTPVFDLSSSKELNQYLKSPAVKSLGLNKETIKTIMSNQVKSAEQRQKQSGKSAGESVQISWSDLNLRDDALSNQGNGFSDRGIQKDFAPIAFSVDRQGEKSSMHYVQDGFTPDTLGRTIDRLEGLGKTGTIPEKQVSSMINALKNRYNLSEQNETRPFSRGVNYTPSGGQNLNKLSATINSVGPQGSSGFQYSRPSAYIRKQNKQNAMVDPEMYGRSSSLPGNSPMAMKGQGNTAAMGIPQGSTINPDAFFGGQGTVPINNRNQSIPQGNSINSDAFFGGQGTVPMNNHNQNIPQGNSINSDAFFGGQRSIPMNNRNQSIPQGNSINPDAFFAQSKSSGMTGVPQDPMARYNANYEADKLNMQNGGSITGNPAQFSGGQNAAPLASSNSHSAGGAGGGGKSQGSHVIQKSVDDVVDTISQDLQDDF